MSVAELSATPYCLCTSIADISATLYCLCTSVADCILNKICFFCNEFTCVAENSATHDALQFSIILLAYPSILQRPLRCRFLQRCVDLRCRKSATLFFASQILQRKVRCRLFLQRMMRCRYALQIYTFFVVLYANSR